MSINKISFLIIVFLAVATLAALGYLKNYNDPNPQKDSQFRKNEAGENINQSEASNNLFQNDSKAIDENMLLPDLRVEPLANPVIQMNQNNQKLLRFPGVFTNVGEGPLELIGQEDLETNTTRATQRIYKKEGGPEERLAGNFVLHPDHNHWHFENFVEFELYSYKEDGSLDKQLLTTGKMTFCIHDFAPSAESLPNKPAKQIYPQCISEIQGLSVGWSDTYQAHIPGQELDITNIADGRYAFRSTVNPEKRVLEKNENNNSSISYIEINDNTVKILPGP